MNNSMVFCRGCGKEIHHTAFMCPSCGAPQQPVSQPVASQANGIQLKNQTVAGLMCFFLGPFGGLHFYLGRPLFGVLYLLFCWTGIPTIISYVELALLAFKTPQEWAAAENNGVLSEPVHVAIKILVFANIPLFFLSVMFWAALMNF